MWLDTAYSSPTKQLVQTVYTVRRRWWRFDARIIVIIIIKETRTMVIVLSSMAKPLRQFTRSLE